MAKNKYQRNMQLSLQKKLEKRDNTSKMKNEKTHYMGSASRSQFTILRQKTQVRLGVKTYHQIPHDIGKSDEKPKNPMKTKDAYK